MAHPLVDQLRFTRSEWLRALDGVTEEDAVRRFGPMNCISWMVGHLAWHEQLTWLRFAQGRSIVPELDKLVASGKPASTPSLEEMWSAWRAVTGASDPYLDTLATETLLTLYQRPPGRERITENVGTMLRRLTYHYWYHVGESQAVRQLLQHTDLPAFVGEIGARAPYRPEEG